MTKWMRKMKRDIVNIFMEIPENQWNAIMARWNMTDEEMTAWVNMIGEGHPTRIERARMKWIADQPVRIVEQARRPW